MLKLVVDTNLFHEFRSLDQLPWDEIGEDDEIVLIVTDVVQTELDDHKKSQRARLKRKAIELSKLFRDMTLADMDCKVIQETAPRVVLQLDDTAFGLDTYGILDLAVPDDQLVGIAKKLAIENADETICLFSNDIRPLRKARAVGLAIKEIPEAWRREPESTDDDKERSRLEQENKRLRSQEPILVFSTETQNPLNITLGSYAPLTSDEIEGFVELLRRENPQETCFDRDKEFDSRTKRKLGIALNLGRYKFKAASEWAIEKYIESDYPDWEHTCRQTLENAHERLNEFDRMFEITFSLSNNGTRPAQDVLLTMRAKGPLVIMPPENVAEHEEDQTEPTALSFPVAPSAPQGQWQRSDLMPSLRMGVHNPVYQRAITSLAGSSRHRHDPNGFYYRDRPNFYVNEYSLTCDQFRHAGAKEVFRCKCVLEMIVMDSIETNALLKFNVEASNLTDPVPLSIPVNITNREMSTYDAVKESLEFNRPKFQIKQTK